MSENKIDYQKIDDGMNYQSYDERLELAQKAGFTTIAEHIVESYRETKSLRKAGECCDVSTTSVKIILDRCGIEPRKPGGHVWQKISDKHVAMIRAQKNLTQNGFKRIALAISKEIGKPVSFATVRCVYLGKTHLPKRDL